jgi:hypothetical protein
MTAPSTGKSSATTEPAEKPSLLNEPAKAAEAAPDKYADFTAPEGFELDAPTMEKASAIFKELNLPQAGAQKLVDFYAQNVQEALNAPYRFWQDTQEQWVSQIKADPEIGGKLDQVKASIGRMYDSFGDPKLVADFKEALNFTGAGNNLAFVKGLYKIAQLATEGRPVRGGNPVEVKADGTTGRPSIAQAMFPKLPQG